VLEVARDLLGVRLVRVLPPGGRREGMIVEVEADDAPHDKACHASRGMTRRTEVMFGEPGHAYVYFVYGMHCCLNIVTGPVGYPAAVLIRAVDPVAGRRWMDPGRTRPSQIASGPGRLTRAFHIDLSLNRLDLCTPGPLSLEQGKPVAASRIARGERVGVKYAGEWARRPWRLGIRGHPALSRSFDGL